MGDPRVGAPQALLRPHDIHGVSSSPPSGSLLCTKLCPWHRRCINDAQALLRSSQSMEGTVLKQ